MVLCAEEVIALELVSKFIIFYTFVKLKN